MYKQTLKNGERMGVVVLDPTPWLVIIKTNIEEQKKSVI